MVYAGSEIGAILFSCGETGSRKSHMDALESLSGVVELDVKKFAEEAFRMEPKARYVGVVDGQFHILISEMREGVQSVTPDDEDRNFVQIMPPIIVEAVEKLQPLLGKLDNVTVRFEKVLLVFFRLEGLVVILSFDPRVSTPFVSSLSESLRKLGSLHLRG